MTVTDATADEMLKHYSAALDEVYRLRVALAREAEIIEGHLEFKSFPDGRRRLAADRVRRMRAAACGDAAGAYHDLVPGYGQRMLRGLGASGTLTREEWEATRG